MENMWLRLRHITIIRCVICNYVSYLFPFATVGRHVEKSALFTCSTWRISVAWDRSSPFSPSRGSGNLRFLRHISHHPITSIRPFKHDVDNTGFVHLELHVPMWNIVFLRVSSFTCASQTSGVLFAMWQIVVSKTGVCHLHACPTCNFAIITRVSRDVEH